MLEPLDDGVVAAAVRRPSVQAGDARLGWLVRQGLNDVRGLLLASGTRPADAFVAGGAPWFLTLFGRDSIWTARMLLPLGTELAGGTLRLLASLQGSRRDTESQEEPGKIPHEVRREDAHLPAVYYGTVDATLLWICLLHDAWRWGMPDAEVAELLPALDAALTWTEAATEAGNGFIAYHDRTGHGLANQGWKDSGDAVRFADGRLAQAPVALAEVQGYAHEAALAAAELLDAFGRPGGDKWRAWAADLASRFRERYWVDGAYGRYPAMALDRDGRQVDAVASNMGHLLGTGLLHPQETTLVARRLAAAELAAGFGLRTMSAKAGGYGPSRYHCGTVWPHDTAIAVLGLARSGHAEMGVDLIEGLLSAGAALPGPLPELWGGDGRDEVPEPVPYPAACRPQAWAAASSVAVLTTVLGLEADVPGGTFAVRPVRPSPVGAVHAWGLRVAGSSLAVETDSTGALVDVRTDAQLTMIN